MMSLTRLLLITFVFTTLLYEVRSSKCCYLCSQEGECYGCWDTDSFCSLQINCQTKCFGTWMAYPPAPPKPSPHSKAALGDPPIIWTKTVDFMVGSPTIDGESIVLLRGDVMWSNTTVGHLERRSLITGDVDFEKDIQSINEDNESFLHVSMQPVVADGHVYVQIDNVVNGPEFFALNKSTGHNIWNSTLDVRAGTNVIAGGGNIYYVNSNITEGHVVSRRASDGQLNWLAPIGPIGEDFTSPILVGDIVYKTGVSTSNNLQNFVYALNVTTGKCAWVAPCRAPPWLARIAAEGETVLLTTTYFNGGDLAPLGQPDGRVEAITHGGGKPFWKIDLPASIGRPSLSSSGAALFTACDVPPLNFTPPIFWFGCTLWAVDTNKAKEDSPFMYDSVMWRYVADRNVTLSPPVIRGDVVFLGGSSFVNGTWYNCTWISGIFPDCNFTDDEQQYPGYEDPFIMALRLTDGQLLWKIPIASANRSYSSKVWKDMYSRAVRIYDAILIGGDLIPAEVLSGKLAQAFPTPDTSTWMPWHSFDVNEEGTLLVYTANETVIQLNVSARPRTASVGDRTAWMAPVAAASCGAAVVIILVVAMSRVYNKKVHPDELPLIRKSPAGSADCSAGSTDVVHFSYVPQNESFGYETIRQLGRGGFGQVYLVRKKDTEVLFSLKKIECRSDRDFRIARREVSILKSLPPHKGLISIVESFTAPSCVYIVLPYYEQGDLAAFISSYPQKTIPEQLIVSFGRQISEVLLHFHSQSPPVVHRDLKPENILLSKDRKQVVVTDFGLSRLVDKTYMHTHAGTLAFMAPEAFDGPYDTKIDIWSLGCIIYAMCHKKSRSCRVMCVHVGRKGFHNEVSKSLADRGYSPLVQDLVRQTLQRNRYARPSAEEVLFRLGDEAPPPLRMGEGMSVSSSEDVRSVQVLRNLQDPSVESTRGVPSPTIGSQSDNPTAEWQSESQNTPTGSTTVRSSQVPQSSVQSSNMPGGLLVGGVNPNAIGVKPSYTGPMPTPATPHVAAPAPFVPPPGLLRGIMMASDRKPNDQPLPEYDDDSDDDDVWVPPPPPPAAS